MFKGEAGDMLRGMMVLLLGSGAARIIGVLSIPVLTRIYSPEDFGVLALYSAFVGVVFPLMTFRYVQAIPLPRTDTMALGLFVLCFKLILVSSVVFAVFFAVFGEVFLKFLGMGVLLPFWWLIVLGSFGAATYELFSMWATRKKQYDVIAKSQFSQALVGNVVKIVLGGLSFGSLGLLLGQVLNQGSGLVILLKDVRSFYKSKFSNLNKGRLLFLAAYYQSFIWFRLPSHFLVTLSLQAPLFMVGVLFSKESTGQLSLAMMALSLPIGLVGSAISKAYYAEIASIGKRNLKRVTEMTFSVQGRLFSVGVPFSLFIYFYAESLFRFVFGEEWVVAGSFASLLAPSILFQFTSSPLMEVINILGVQKIYLYLQVLRVVGLAVIFMLASSLGFEIYYFVLCLSLYFSAFYLLVSIIVFLLLSRFRRV